MGLDGGEAGRIAAAEEEYIRRELSDTNNFCNAFWGSGDAGYEVIQSRMKTASKTMDEVRALYKERSEIEADYAKRLGKLAKVAVGKEETGATKAALDVVRAELDMTSRVHSDLSSMMRKDLEGSLADFQSKAASSRKNAAATIEKLYKNKQAQENYVNKSRERYEQDCIKINGYTAQSSLVQGRDLDKVTSKLDKAQSTVATNDKDYQNFVRALKDTTFRWNGEWKAYLDQCQDLEEERLEFIKSNLWNYANALSAVCVADDEGCERVRVALENCETGADIADFIQYRGTGPAIPEPPEYINYAKGQPPPPRPAFRTANFQRTTTRTIPPPPPPSQTFVAPTPASQAPPPPAMDSKDHRGDSSAPPPGSGGMAETAVRRNGAPASQGPEPNGPTNQFRPPPGAVGLPGMSPTRPAADARELSGQISPSRGQPEQGSVPQSASLDKAEKRMSTKNFLARTPSTRADAQGNSTPTANSKRASQVPSQMAPTAATGSSNDEDPIAKALANLRARPGGKSPAPNASAQLPPAAGSAPSVYQQPPSSSSHRLSQVPPRSPSPSIGAGMHRPSSPSAAFMQAPQAPSSPLPVEEVLGSYGQSFPGERRRSVSRQNSVSSAISSRSNAQGAPKRDSQAAAASNSADGFAGVGARGRSPSPQPFGRPASRQQQGRPAPQGGAAARPHHQQGQSSMSTPSQQAPPRSSTPLGISLDASGSVTHDQMAQEYMRRAGSVPPLQQAATPQPQQQAPQQQQHYQQQPQQQPQYYGNQQQQPARPSSVVYGGHQQQPAPSQISTASSSYTITPGQYGGQQGIVHHGQQAGHYAGHQQQPSAPAGYGQAPHFSHQDSSGSLGRASGYNNYGQHQAQPSASQSLHGNMAQGHPGQSGTPAPAQAAYGQGGYQETPASAYMHQYQRQHQGSVPPPSGTSTPGPYGQQQPQQSSQGWGQPSPVGTTAPGVPHPQQGYSQPPAHQQQQQQPQQAPPTQATSPAAAPTGQYSDAGKPILFYVKAMYDYSATTDEEFSFTTGDIIAVTQTDPDGWWQGELLDEARRRRGATTFPSNFTTLLT